MWVFCFCFTTTEIKNLKTSLHRMTTCRDGVVCTALCWSVKLMRWGACLASRVNSPSHESCILWSLMAFKAGRNYAHEGHNSVKSLPHKPRRLKATPSFTFSPYTCPCDYTTISSQQLSKPLPDKPYDFKEWHLFTGVIQNPHQLELRMRKALRPPFGI